MPVIERAKKPCLTAAQVESMMELSNTAEEHLLYLLLASTGLRIGECLALEWRHVSNDARSLNIEQKVNRFGEIEKSLKTKAGNRGVDADPLVSAYLMAARHEGLRFRTQDETPHLA